MATNVDRSQLIKEGIHRLIPNRRISNKGRKPTVRTRELARPIPREQRRNTEQCPDEQFDQDTESKIAKILDEK